MSLNPYFLRHRGARLRQQKAPKKPVLSAAPIRTIYNLKFRLTRSFQQSEETNSEEGRERFNNSFNLSIANAGNLRKPRIGSLIRAWYFTGEVGRVLKSRFENVSTWIGLPYHHLLLSVDLDRLYKLYLS